MTKSRRKPSTAARVAATHGPERFLNRELSWLAFDERVLALAEDERVPLLERVKFCAICSTNLDEFFQVRVAGLQVQLDAGVVAESADGMSPAEQLQEIHLATERLVRRQEQIFAKALLPALAEEGIRFVDWASLGSKERVRLGESFAKQIHPALTPLAVDPAHPFPWISNLSLNLGVVIGDRESGARRFARVKVPPVFPRFVDLGDGERWLPIEQLIAAHLDSLFPGMDVLSSQIFRVTRDAALLVDEGEADDLLAAIESGLHRRLRVNDAVRLEIDAGAEDEVRSLLERELDLDSDESYAVHCLLDLGGLWQICQLDRPDLKDAPFTPATQRRLRPVEGGSDFFATIREADVLVHHPYDSFGSSVVAFLAQAAHDEDVIAIKHTLYRTSAHEENPIVQALIHAAKEGTEVVALVEIKARFDEESNIEFARSLESAGANVVYGLVGLKTHAKIALIVRREGDGLRRYVHIGTGNYHPETARLYEDLGLFTSSEEIGAEVGELFNYLTGCGDQGQHRKLLVAPERLRQRLLDEIRTEMDSKDGRIVIKVNGLSDPGIIDALYDASAAGVQIDLLVRGVCCLRAGVPGLSENIRVRSIVGRYLEHSRVFRFGSQKRGPRYFIGSADLMTRNLDLRVEVMAPIDDPALRERVEEMLRVDLDPQARSWELGADGGWQPVPEDGGFSTHEHFQEIASRS